MCASGDLMEKTLTEAAQLLQKISKAAAILLGGVVPPRRCRVSSILRGNSKTECLLEEVDGLDDDDPFFFGEKACSFLP
jgi:hypothetical protein